ncbi:WxL domain-containing protein [uncultured Vagococcus sp.]|uniref:WxL domain-containing protein n=1 Tax=uncultured Vagococcus sp. TaxID=189676 RepID=UPI0028D55C7C|nr:WxL domain-containing protein [uncultured Vagococcus sp.]
MNKKVVGTLVLAIATGAAFLPTTAKAAGTAETGVGIGFSSGPNTIIPGPYDDQLSLINRPTSFQFGETNESSATTRAYNKVAEGKQYIAALEDRPDGERTAWKLNAQLSPLLTGAENTGDKGLQATLSFSTADISTFSIPKDPETGLYPTVAETIEPLTAYAGDALKGFQKVSLKAGADSATPIMTATADAGKGGFAAEVKNVQLLVNGKQDALTNGKTFSSTVTWTLDDTK